MITCNICHTENIDNAKFCKVCGKSLNEFSNIQWKDTLLINWKITEIDIFPFLIIGSIILIISFIIGLPGIFTILIFFKLCIVLVVIRRKAKRQLKSIASRIEVTDSTFRQIAKGNKVGLYNWKYRYIVLPVKYNSITIMDNNYIYLKVEQNKKYGIYSLILDRFIVNCEYDMVSSFKNNIAAIQIGDKIKHVDSQGNIF